MTFQLTVCPLTYSNLVSMQADFVQPALCVDQSKMASTRWGNPVCDPAHLSEVLPHLSSHPNVSRSFLTVQPVL